MRTRLLPGLMVTALVAAASSACSTQLGQSTTGELGRVDFSYGATCFFGCSMDRPVLVGGSERIDVTGPGDAKGVTAASTDPAIVEFNLKRSCSCDRSSGNSGEGMSTDAQGNCPAGFEKTCDNSVDMQALAQGDAKLQLFDAQGQLLDRVVVHVRKAASAQFQQSDNGLSNSQPIDQLVVKSGNTVTLSAKLLDADGQALIARDAVTWGSQDKSVAGFPVYTLTSQDSVDDSAQGQSDWITVKGVQPGSTHIKVQVPGLTQAVPVTVTGN